MEKKTKIISGQIQILEKKIQGIYYYYAKFIINGINTLIKGTKFRYHFQLFIFSKFKKSKLSTERSKKHCGSNRYRQGLSQ
jgi:hypothetical protein